MHLAPIVLFVYNRPWHTEQTLRALQQNDLANESALYIYADGPKENASDEELKKTEQVRKLIRKELWCREVKIVESKINKGLADSVIAGVTEIVNRYGKVIVLEDDLITAQGFLRYMNDALSKFATEKIVMQIAGFSFPLQEIKKDNTAYFMRIATSWGWATWSRAWLQFDLKADGYQILKTDASLSHRFDLNGAQNCTSMMMDQMEKKTIDSWAIRWWWSVFKNNGLVLFPDKSLVNNIGFDEEGTHTKQPNPFIDKNFDSTYSITNFPDAPVVNSAHFEHLQNYLIHKTKQSVPPKKTLLKRVLIKARIF